MSARKQDDDDDADDSFQIFCHENLLSKHKTWNKYILIIHKNIQLGSN